MVTFLKRDKLANTVGFHQIKNAEVQMNTSQQYMHTRDDPFIPEKKYKFIPYFLETIRVKMVLSPSSVDRLREMFVLGVDKDGQHTQDVFIQFKKGENIHVRKLQINQFPDIIDLRQVSIVQFEIKYREYIKPFNITKKIRRGYTHIPHIRI